MYIAEWNHHYKKCPHLYGFSFCLFNHNDLMLHLSKFHQTYDLSNTENKFWKILMLHYASFNDYVTATDFVIWNTSIWQQFLLCSF